jgi:hypothetical protein
MVNSLERIMMFLKENIPAMTLPLIGIFAVLTLAWPKPNASAIFLFIQAIIIDIYLFFAHGLTSIAFSAGLLLTFFAMMTIGSTYYFEISFTRKLAKIPQLSILVGAFLLILFWRNSHKFPMLPLIEEPLPEFRPFQINTLIISFFALFTILFCASLIFDMKNPKSGE